jgi:hypothetical protein
VNLRLDVDDAAHRARRDRGTISRHEADRPHRRGAAVLVRRERPAAQRISVCAADALREVNVTPAREHVTEQLVRPNVLARVHDWTDVPVAELASSPRPLHGDVRRVAVDIARRDRVDGGPVVDSDVDAEMEGRERALRAEVEARVVERASERMGPVERLDRPRVRPCGGGPAEREEDRPDPDDCSQTRNAESVRSRAAVCRAQRIPTSTWITMWSILPRATRSWVGTTVTPAPVRRGSVTV